MTLEDNEREVLTELLGGKSYPVAEDIFTRSERHLLRRLEKDGLVRASWEITPKGEQALAGTLQAP